MICNLRRTYKVIDSTLMNRNIYNVYNGPLLKFCHGRNNFIDENICDCTTVCNLTFHPHHQLSVRMTPDNSLVGPKTKELTYHTHQICSLTQEYRNIKDCLCVNNCSADKNELMLYFDDLHSDDSNTEFEIIKDKK